MFIQFHIDKEKIITNHRDAWGYPRMLTHAEKERVYEGFRFIRVCYRILIILFGLSMGMIAYLSFSTP